MKVFSTITSILILTCFASNLVKCAPHAVPKEYRKVVDQAALNHPEKAQMISDEVVPVEKAHDDLNEAGVALAEIMNKISNSTVIMAGMVSFGTVVSCICFPIL